MTSLKCGLVALGFGLAMAGVAGDSTVSEADRGDFSGDFHAPTVIANGATTVNGIWSGGNDYDLLAFTQLKAGAQTITLSFAPAQPDWGLGL